MPRRPRVLIEGGLYHVYNRCAPGLSMTRPSTCSAVTASCTVVSNNAACRYDSIIQVVPITRLRKRELRPYEARVVSDACSLDKPSRVVANQFRTISKARVSEIMGRLTADEERSLARALRVQLGLE